MSDDIANRLRNKHADDLLAWEAADEIERLRAERHEAIKQSEDARRWLRDACAEIARIDTRFYDAVTPQQIAERNGWDCYRGGASNER